MVVLRHPENLVEPGERERAQARARRERRDALGRDDVAVGQVERLELRAARRERGDADVRDLAVALQVEERYFLLSGSETGS